MAQQGYDEVLRLNRHRPPASGIARAFNPPLRRDSPARFPCSAMERRVSCRSAHTQIIVPIRREAQVIGLFLLESTSDLQGNLAFLNQSE